MASVIYNLDRDAILMLYLADELSAEDRVEVELMLHSDTALRSQFEQLTRADASMKALLSAADKAQPLPSPQASTVRKVSAAIGRWQIEKLKPVPAVKKPRVAAWAWSAAAVAAILIIGIFILWSRVDDGKNDAVAEAVKKLSVQGSTADDASDDPGHHGESAVADAANDEKMGTEKTGDDFTPAAAADGDSQLTLAEQDMDVVNLLASSLRPREELITP